ncbi:MAG: hypothetical protein GXY77_13025 [Fibrobacter sp.]|nr:hypothetical protein [Fibrobacter sp.]
MPRKILYIQGIAAIVFAIIIFLNNRDYFSDVFLSEKTGKSDQLPKLNLSLEESFNNDFMNSGESDLKDSVENPIFFQKIKVSDCIISNRPDIRLNLEFEMWYENQIMGPEIIIRKNDIQTIVKNVLRVKELGEIKKEQLRKELIETINSIFEMDILTEIKFRSFHIEKAEST